MRNRNNNPSITIPLSEIKKIKSALNELEKFHEERDNLIAKTNELEKIRESISYKETLIDNLLHELRHINSGLKDSINQIDFDEHSSLKDIWAHANLLSIRMLMYDFEVNPEILTTTLKFELPIYKRIDKITKCFFHLPRCKRFPIKLYGETFLSFLATDVLELAFYIIIHNAIKYSKSYSDIKIEFEEQIDPLNINNILTVRFTNYGFIPSENDQEHLFERGYRGENSLGIKGSGIGLYNLKRICNASGVDVSIKVEPELERPKEGSFSIILRFEGCHRKK